MTEQELQEIQNRWAAATPGPWRWDVNKTDKLVHLSTTHSGRYHVMQFRRYGMQGAQPMFQKYEKYEGPVTERGSEGMHKVEDFAIPRVSHMTKYGLDINHPDAQAIANAPEDVRKLIKEVKRLQKENQALKRQQETPV
ncbi:hypothetical protein [Aneurinibacillus migulanus]|uniref:Uncharacterized protein n=1 Tax=Aneurinibacillus migulanus TaxID=47500 RepID=A0A0D1VL79_ANEMI|nr:hypothetical protein [Aneurinibacillus migulanus]KIV60314.1 hypothetical protein TS65_00615 [Aneurinibacillus migulanus]KON90486.1 hypothetical protein AF333_28800 [Aneurinibacillus migulanus]MED0894943.1 hypothetical protein [Aneurinibacillus migulanus]MED1614414.1 hypothetical protein [Aneurinibacillus migulanus]SDJ78461.1 hypothetical protein SAMN04487909_12874 [Aneurinibacillus migulanus]